MKRKTTSLKIDEELWKKVKINCILKGIEISDYIEKIVIEDLKKNVKIKEVKNDK